YCTRNLTLPNHLIPCPRPLVSPLRHHPLLLFTPTATTEIYTLSLHDALPISAAKRPVVVDIGPDVSLDCLALRQDRHFCVVDLRSEEHTSELQSRFDLVCRLLLEKKKRCDMVRSTACCASVSPTITQHCYRRC